MHSLTAWHSGAHSRPVSHLYVASSRIACGISRLCYDQAHPCLANGHNVGGPLSGNGDATPRRPRGRPRKAPPSGDVDQGAADSQAGAKAGDGDALGQLHQEQHHPPQPQHEEHGSQPEPQRRRRGRPPRNAIDNDSCRPASAASAPGPPTGPVAEPPSRPRGRPRSAPDSPPPPGSNPSRDLELRTLLLRQLELRPEELRPPRASWLKLMESMTARALAGRVAELREALGLDAVRRIARRCPHAMQLTPSHILAKLADLNLRLRLSRRQLLAAVCGFPSLLGSSPEAVGARVATLVQQSGRSDEFVSAMVVSQPVLLGLSPATLSYRVGLLHEAASLLPNNWGSELTSMRPATLGRLLRCSDLVLQRLIYTYLRTATNGKKFDRIRSMATICCQPAARWNRDNPLFAEWLAAGEADRSWARTQRWPGWYQQPGGVDWWEGAVGGRRGRLEGPREEGGGDEGGGCGIGSGSS
uniref:Mitochondrial transcription termination factor n=1 Tax=Yamagishiella unicocca TaxID=51707 RepID=A0A2Z5X889_9CHLO|nr:mitochondrial transcription termination factor [Yamagishiella unicocca]